MLSTSSVNQQQHLFSAYRALGLVTNHVPCILRIHQRHSSHLLLTAIGKVFHAYRLNTMQALIVSDAHSDDIQAIAANSRLVFVAAGSSIYVYRRICHLYQTLSDHQGLVQHLLPFGDDHLISVDQSNTLRVWDIQSATVYFSLEFDTKIFHITFLLHPATYVNKLLLASRQGTMQLWNIKSNQLLHEFFSRESSTSSITVLAQSTVVDVVAVGYNNGQIRLHNLRYDETLVTFSQDFNGPITAIAFRLDNIPHMATGSSTGHICIWNLDSCRLVSQVREAQKQCPVAALHYIPGEPLLVSNGGDNALREWIFDMPDGQSCRLYRERCGHWKSPRCVRFHDNEIVVSAGNDGRLRTFHTILDNLSRCFGRTTRYQWEMALNETQDNDNDEVNNEEDMEQPLPIVDLRCELIKENDWDGILAVHDARRRVSAWNYVRATRSKHRFEHERFGTKVYHQVEVVATCCDISPCGNFCVIGYSTGHMDMFNMQSGLYRGSFDGGPMKFSSKNVHKRLKSSPFATAHSASICGLSFDSLNIRMVSCDADGIVKLWRIKNKALLTSSTALDTKNDESMVKVSKMIVHRDSGLFALSLTDHTIKIYDFETTIIKCIRNFNQQCHTDRINAFVFTPDARWLLSTSMDKTMRIWDIPSGQLIDTIEFDQSIVTLAISPNGDMIATGHTEALGVYLWSNRSMYGASIVNLTNSDLFVGDFQSPEQISTNLVTLSTLPESKWKNLLVLDTIRQRNKPKEPMNVPKQAPFFLPTVSNLRGFVFVNPDDEQNEKKTKMNSSRIHQTENFLYESPLTNLLDRKDKNCSLVKDVIHLLKDLGMAKIEYEFRCLATEQGGSLERMLTFIDILHQAFDNKQDYDLISSYLALVLQLHGMSSLQTNQDLIESIRKIQLKQKETWTNIQRQLQTTIALVKYIKSVTTI